MIDVVKFEYWNGTVYHCRCDVERHKPKSVQHTREMMRQKFLFLPFEEQMAIAHSLKKQKREIVVVTKMQMTEEEYAKVGYKQC